MINALQEKAAYKEAFAGLRELKQEIEHLQMLLEQSHTKLQRDFEHWMSLMLRQQPAASAGPPLRLLLGLSPKLYQQCQGSLLKLPRCVPKRVDGPVKGSFCSDF